MNLASIRAETPTLSRQTFLASAGASLPPDPVVEATIAHLRLEADIGGYAAADRAQERHEAVCTSIARLIGVAPDEIALMESATLAWQMGFHALTWQAGDRILTGRAEYAANYVAFLQIARRFGVEIGIIPDDEFGATDPQALRTMIDHAGAPWTADDSYTLRPHARRFEAWESSIAGRLGLVELCAGMVAGS